ncbi:hypothetical protein [Planococcus shixiaomingii]|nr:hypothetical protein [Planococcus sp. N028]
MKQNSGENRMLLHRYAFAGKRSCFVQYQRLEIISSTYVLD